MIKVEEMPMRGVLRCGKSAVYMAKMLCAFVAFGLVGMAWADSLPYGDTPTVTAWELTGVEKDGEDYLVAGSNATLKITLGGCHLDWTDKDYGGTPGRTKQEIKQVLLCATGVVAPAEKVVYIFGGVDTSVLYARDILNDASFNDYYQIPVFDEIPAENISDQDSKTIITLPFTLLPGAGMHGKFKFELHIECNSLIKYNLGSYGWYEMSPMSLRVFYSTNVEREIERSVFFDKYGHDFEDGPNWFVYWGDDGACPSLKIKYIYVHSASFGGLVGEWKKHNFMVYRRMDESRYSSFYGGCNMDTGIVSLHQDAPEQHYWRVVKVKDNVGTVHEFGGPSVYGIYSVEEVIAHERSHKKIYDAYRAVASRIGALTSNGLDFDKMKSCDSDCMKDPPVVWYVNGKMKSRDCVDYLTDEQENSYAYGFSVTNADSFDVASEKGIEYKAYGDNEFLCMIAGQEALSKPVEANDWAFPGHQSWLPPENERCRPGGVRAKTASVAVAADEGDGNSQDGLPLMEVRLNDFVIGAKNAFGFAESIDARVTITSEGAATGRMDAIVTDTNDYVVAYCQKDVQIHEGTQSIDFSFDGHQIYGNRLDGPYRFRAVSLTCDGKVEKVMAGIWDDFDIKLDGSYTDFVRNDAYILRDGIAECATSDGVEIGVNVEVNTPGDYQLIALVDTTNRTVVSRISINTHLEIGTNQVKLVVKDEDIVDSWLDGPYVIRSIRLLRGATNVCGFKDFYTTRKVYIASFFDFSDPNNPFDPVSGEDPFEDYVPPETNDEEEDMIPTGEVSFADSELSAAEGETISLRIAGGASEKAASVKVYISYQTAVVADLDLAKGMVDGVVPKGGLKFPLTLKWESGEADSRIVTIPVKVDKAVEGDEQLTFQLASAQGQRLGSTSVCTATIKDSNTYAVLQDGVMNPGIKVSSKVAKGSPAWQVGAGNAYDLNGLHGLCHAETPAMPMGSSSELAVGTFKKGKLRFHMRFTGPTDEKTPSTLSVYNGKNLVGTIGHGRTVRTGWALSVTNEWNAITLNANDKNNAVRFVFTQGSDPDVHVELSSLSYDDGNGATVCNIFAMASDSAGGCVTGSGPYVKGANVSIKAKANPGWVFRHWLAYGIEDRPIVWNDKAAVSWKATQDLTVEAVFEKLPYVRTLADPADGGKVTGSGYCAAGKKATLKATANKGYVFEGWYKVEDDPAGRMILPMATTPTLVLDRSAKPGKSNAQQTVVTTDADRDATYFAKFITMQEDLAAIALSVDGVALSATEAFATNLICGVAVNWPIVSSGLSETTVKVAGLPSGLKFAAKPVTSKVGTGKDAILVTNVPANTIYGAPTAASKTAKDRKTGAMTVTPNAIRVTVTTAGKSSQTYQINTTIDPLPSWAQGTFAGGWEISNEDTAPASGGQVSLTISAAGKLSGKALGDGLKYTLAAPYYSDFVTVPDEDGLVSNFLADVTASWSCREGSKTIRTNEIVQVSVADNGIGGYAEVADWFEAYTVNWKVEPWKTLGKAFDKQIRTYAIMSDGTISEREDDLSASLGESIAGRVSLKFAANGNVSVAGEFVAGYDAKKARYATVKATGAATLVPVDGERGVVFVYLTPKGLSPYVCCMEVLLP